MYIGSKDALYDEVAIRGYEKLYSLLQSANDFDLNNPAHQQLANLDKNILTIVEDILQQGIKLSVFEPTLDIKFMSTHLLTTYISMVNMAFQKSYYLIHERGITSDEFIKKMIDTILYLVLKR